MDDLDRLEQEDRFWTSMNERQLLETIARNSSAMGRHLHQMATTNTLLLACILLALLVD